MFYKGLQLKILLIIALCVAAGSVFARDWKDVYVDGQELRFSIYRKNKCIGDYSTRFLKAGNTTEVHVEMNLHMNLLWLFEYNYEYRAIERWQGDSFKLLRVEINDNGSKRVLEATSRNGVLIGRGPEGDIHASLPILTTHHFNAEVVNRKRVLNTITGNVNQVEIKFLGKKTVEVNQGEITGFHYRYFGQLRDTDVWYDKDDRWIKLKFKGKDGVPLEFICMNCRNELVKSEI